MNTLLQKAIELAVKSHGNTLDKAGELYILHPIRVMLKCKFDIKLMIVAILHDVVEDCNITLDNLRKMGFPEDVVLAIDSVSRRENEVYMDFIRRANENELGVIVKYLDIQDNMNRLNNLSEEEINFLGKRYILAIQVITENFHNIIKNKYNLGFPLC